MSKHEQSKKFFKLWAKSYDRSILTPYLRKLQRMTLAHIHSENSKIIDISCGTGWALEQLHTKFPRAKLYGIDVTPEMLAVARKRLPTSVDLREGMVQNLPYKDNAFDYVYSNEAFHHYEQQGRSLQEMKRVCKNGGVVIVTDPEIYFRWAHWVFEVVEPGCVRVNTKKEMYELFKNAGFQEIAQERIGWFGLLTKGIKN